MCWLKSASTEEARSWEDLPEAAQKYIETLETYLGIPVAIVSVGPKRKATLTRMSLWDMG